MPCIVLRYLSTLKLRRLVLTRVHHRNLFVEMAAWTGHMRAVQLAMKVDPAATFLEYFRR